jgi:hypothetical protein
MINSEGLNNQNFEMKDEEEEEEGISIFLTNS